MKLDLFYLFFTCYLLIVHTISSLEKKISMRIQLLILDKLKLMSHVWTNMDVFLRTKILFGIRINICLLLVYCDLCVLFLGSWPEFFQYDIGETKVESLLKWLWDTKIKMVFQITWESSFVKPRKIINTVPTTRRMFKRGPRY